MTQDQLLIAQGIMKQLLTEDASTSHTMWAYLTQSERDHIVKTMGILQGYITTLDRAILHP